MQIAEIVTQVRNIINEMATQGDSFSQETDEAIKAFVSTAARQVASLPGYVADPKVISEGETTNFLTRPDGLYFLRLSLPDDCLRPISLNIVGWVTPVYVFHPVTDRRFLAQYSSAPGIGNGPSSPIAFITADNGTYILAHAVKERSDYTLRYMAVPAIAADGTIGMPDKYTDALAYTTAGLYMQSVDDFTKAKTAFDTAAACMQHIPDAPSES